MKCSISPRGGGYVLLYELDKGQDVDDIRWTVVELQIGILEPAVDTDEAILVVTFGHPGAPFDHSKIQLI